MNPHVTPPIPIAGLPSKDEESRDTTAVDSPERQDTAEDQVSEAIPDGGYGWVVLAACFIHTFWLNAVSCTRRPFVFSLDFDSALVHLPPL